MHLVNRSNLSLLCGVATVNYESEKSILVLQLQLGRSSHTIDSQQTGRPNHAQRRPADKRPVTVGQRNSQNASKRHASACNTFVHVPQAHSCDGSFHVIPVGGLFCFVRYACTANRVLVYIPTKGTEHQLENGKQPKHGTTQPRQAAAVVGRLFHPKAQLSLLRAAITDCKLATTGISRWCAVDSARGAGQCVTQLLLKLTTITSWFWDEMRTWKLGTHF